MLKNILIIALAIMVGVLIYANKPETLATPLATLGVGGTDTLTEKVLPANGVVLPAVWGNLGKQLVATGVIDREKFEQLYASRDELTTEMKALLTAENNGKLKITEENSGMILNLLWALGLGAKNEILETGPMMDKNYGGAQNFASTGGWTIAKDNAMNHYSKHQFFNLTPEQQALVNKISRGIYRPCCGNSTYFPDCNHGMAMLGFLELMASQGVSEPEMWQSALALNSFWFPDTYLTIATYLKEKNIEWQNVNPQEILGADYSSGQGYAKIASQVAPTGNSHGGGNGCGVGASAPQRQSSGCGIDAGQSVPVPQRQPSGCGI
ncbi:MAG: hypothetical protein AAB453_02115 [Patescibacteria group bacterium]